MQAFDVVDSTNTRAAKWIENGAPHGAVVVADFQSRGRGRHGRSWSARPGLNLTFSVVLRPDLPAERIGLLTIAACAAVAGGIDRFVDPLYSAIKWPNDVYLNGKKASGMLMEASWNAQGKNPAVVLGVGVNVNQVEFPPDLEDRATSLALESGRIVPRADLFAALLADLETALSRLASDEETIRHEYVRKLMSVGKDVRLRFADTGRDVTGIVLGVDPSGALILNTASGPCVFHAGEVMRAS